MVLVDTSVWINHLRDGEPKLKTLLLEIEVATHPFILGELACGSIKNRDEVFSLLDTLPACPTVTSSEFRVFVEKNKLMSQGIGFVDINILASALIARIPLWTTDKNLKKVARRLDASFT